MKFLAKSEMRICAYWSRFFVLSLVLLMVGVGSGLSFSELVEGYVFDFDSEELGDVEIEYGIVGDELVFDVEVGGDGVYDFYVDVYDGDDVVSGFGEFDLSDDVEVCVKSYYLSGRSEFDCVLRVYDSDGALVYLEEFDVEGLSYEVGFDVLSVGYEDGEVCVEMNSSVDVAEDVSLFLGSDGEVDGEFDFEVGDNSVCFDVVDVLVDEHYVGVVNVSGVLVGSRLFELDYLGEDFSWLGYVDGSYLSGCGLVGIDGDGDGLFDYLELVVEGFVDEGGEYFFDGVIVAGDSVFVVNDSFGVLNSGVVKFGFLVNGERVYVSGVDGEISAYGVSLWDGDGLVDSLDVCGVTNFSYDDFGRVGLADLVVDFSEGEGLVFVNVSNVGENGAFGFELEVGCGDYEESWVVDFLDVDEFVLFEVESSCENWSWVVDSGGVVDEEDEENNFGVFVLSGEDECVVELVNSSWGVWENVTGCVGGVVLQRRSRVEFDSAFCGATGNLTYYEEWNVSCLSEDEDDDPGSDDEDDDSGSRSSSSKSRHVFSYVCEDWGAWENVTDCVGGVYVERRVRVCDGVEDYDVREVGCEVVLNYEDVGLSCGDEFEVCFSGCDGFSCLGCFVESFGCRIRSWF